MNKYWWRWIYSGGDGGDEKTTFGDSKKLYRLAE